MGVKITDRWTNDGLKLQKAINSAFKKELFVGYTEDLEHIARESKLWGTEGGEVESTAEIAIKNELGTENTPKRPFIANSVDMYEPDIRKAVKTYFSYADYSKSDAIESSLELIGRFQTWLIKASIEEGEYEPNSPATIEDKGSATPLIDTGQMLNQPTYVVRNKTDSSDNTDIPF